MPEKTSPVPAPAPTPTPAPAPQPKGGWFQKIPRNILFSPGGVILILLALIIEIIDWIPVPILDQIIELPLEIIFITLLVIITKTSLKSLVIPFIIERIPVISDVVPTWLIRMFI